MERFSDEGMELVAAASDKLWNRLVPDNGPADSIQGEMIRVMGRISSEVSKE